VLQKIGRVAYRLQLPEESQIHPVFHVSQLKPYTPDYRPVYSELSLITDLTTVDTELERILDRRLVKKENEAVPQVQVKWTHFPAASATWEDYNVLKARFPTCLAFFGGGRCHT
jgi:hypothetical protein